MPKSVRTREPAEVGATHLLDLRALVLVLLAALAGLAAAGTPSAAVGIGVALAAIHCLHRLIR